ncbi:MAG TPA: methionyl-tRNA formyltransferase [Pyrinomonadaceae bacterium]|nr:methionyl-tRNA formyltransferase [Pyrinomonadaceae bacterium]
MRLIFMGTPETAVPTLRRCVEDGHEVVAVWTQPDRPAGRGNRPKASAVKEYALIQGLTVWQPEKIKTGEALAVFTAQEVDAVVVVAYGRILPASFLRAPRKGCVNVHFSLLPKYRGAAPVNWAIARGESVTGVTTMLMDEGLDTGAILLQRTAIIDDDETAPQLLARLAVDGAELLSETLARLDEIEPRPQRDAEATLAPVLRREDGLVDWSHEARDIERRVRGFQPWPGAYTTYNNRRLVIRRAAPISTGADADENGGASEAGQILEARGDELRIACGKGTALRLLEVQLEGKQRMSARNFVNGARVSAGERMG